MQNRRTRTETGDDVNRKEGYYGSAEPKGEQVDPLKSEISELGARFRVEEGKKSKVIAVIQYRGNARRANQHKLRA